MAPASPPSLRRWLRDQRLGLDDRARGRHRRTAEQRLHQPSCVDMGRSRPAARAPGTRPWTGPPAATAAATLVLLLDAAIAAITRATTSVASRPPPSPAIAWMPRSPRRRCPSRTHSCRHHLEKSRASGGVDVGVSDPAEELSRGGPRLCLPLGAQLAGIDERPHCRGLLLRLG